MMVRFTIRRTITRLGFGFEAADSPAPMAGSRPLATCQPRAPSTTAKAAIDPVHAVVAWRCGFDCRRGSVIVATAVVVSAAPTAAAGAVVVVAVVVATASAAPTAAVTAVVLAVLAAR